MRRIYAQRHNRERRNHDVQSIGNGAEFIWPDNRNVLGVKWRRQKQIQNDHDKMHATVSNPKSYLCSLRQLSRSKREYKNILLYGINVSKTIKHFFTSNKVILGNALIRTFHNFQHSILTFFPNHSSRSSNNFNNGNRIWTKNHFFCKKK